MAVKVYGNFGDFAAFNGWLDDALGFARQVIPSKTVVGKLISGDVAGATVGAREYLSGGSKATPMPTPMVQPRAGVMPDWLLPVAIGGGALLLIMTMRKGRKGRR